MHHRTQPVIEIRTSNRRRTTGVAYWEDGRIVVVVPARLSAEVRDSFAAQLVDSLLRRGAGLHSSDDDLARRANDLGARYFDGLRPASIRWSTRQRKRWGSCSIHTREIRIAASLKTVPDWVLDAVIVHELAHLVEANHSPRFHALVARFPRNDDANWYLKGLSHGLQTAGVGVAEDDGWSDGDGDEEGGDSVAAAGERPSVPPGEVAAYLTPAPASQRVR